MRFRFFDRNDEMKDACLSVILTPDQVGGDIKDTVYQTEGIAFSCKDEIPNHVGNDIMDKF